MAQSAQRIVLASRPVGEPKPENFRLEECPVPTPGPGQVLTRTVWLSLDPYMRGRMSDAPSYAAPVQVNGVMEGETLGEIISSKADGYSSGDYVRVRAGWQTHGVADGKGLIKVDPKAAPLSTALGVLGMPGMTAYVGLLDIGNPQPGETVVVAAASGAVGSAVGQIAKIKGARAVGIAGGPDKCRYVKETLGFDACVDHRSPGLADELKKACPNGIDVYFENVGGPVFDAVFPQLNRMARMPVCGRIATYNNPMELGKGGDRTSMIFGSILVKSLTIRGFIVSNFASRYPDFIADMTKWFREGKVKHRETVVEGLANAPKAFMGLLRGENFGKQLVRVGPDKV